MNIMLLDDDRDCLLGLSEVIGPTGVSYDVFDDPEKAVESYKEKRYDLVISDMKMPKMNGIQVLKAIRACNEKARIILVSGYSELEMVMEALNQHAYAFFSKPVNVGQLLDAVEAVAAEIQLEQVRLQKQQDMEQEYRRLQEQMGQVNERMGTVAR